MSLLSKKAVVLLLAAVAGLGALNAQAAKPKEKASTNNVSMLDGKFTFVLPKGFTANPLPVVRVIHSFDPCMSCAVHVLDVEGTELGIATS